MEVNIALAQYPISKFGSLTEWSGHVEQWVREGISKGGELLVFPEYASMELVSLFKPSIQADLHGQMIELQTVLSDFLDIFRKLAIKYNCTILSPSFPVLQKKEFVNRCHVFSQNGEGYQDKWFMTRFENEIWGISNGRSNLTVFEASWGKFGVQICYDIEFPIGSQILANHGVQLILAPSCTETIRGATRVHVGARSRALEQQVFVGVSQTILNAPWSPAVDINFGFAAIYSAPDIGLPSKGILKMGKKQQPGWIIKRLDFEKNNLIQSQGQVFNSKDMNLLKMSLDKETNVVSVNL